MRKLIVNNDAWLVVNFFAIILFWVWMGGEDECERVDYCEMTALWEADRIRGVEQP